jgi:hypothetical protein
MDGYVVDLPRALEIAHDTQSSLLIDDAHSTGVLGETGRGTFEHFGLRPEASSHGIPGLVVMGTLSKALGSAGAFAATDSSTRELLLNRARPFVFSTALPPAVAAASLASLPQTRVRLIGFAGERCVPAVESSARITQHLLAPTFTRWPRRLFLLYAPLKVLWQILQLLHLMRWCRR